MKENILKEFLDKYKLIGEEKFYKFLLVYSIKKLIFFEKENKVSQPNLELLEIHNQFIILYRREGEDIYLNIAKVFRKAAHKIYRVMLKKGLINKSDKFLNLV